MTTKDETKVKSLMLYTKGEARKNFKQIQKLEYKINHALSNIVSIHKKASPYLAAFCNDLEQAGIVDSNFLKTIIEIEFRALENFLTREPTFLAFAEIPGEEYYITNKRFDRYSLVANNNRRYHQVKAYEHILKLLEQEGHTLLSVLSFVHRELCGMSETIDELQDAAGYLQEYHGYSNSLRTVKRYLTEFYDDEALQLNEDNLKLLSHDDIADFLTELKEEQ